jgi:hypothetical protein
VRLCAVKFVPEITFRRGICVPDWHKRAAEMSIVAISETSAASKETTSQVGIDHKPASDTCLNDWKRFCFVLREIASGESGRPLSGLEAQKRAQAVLTECGYTWPGRAQVHEPVVAPFAAPESLNAQASIDSEQSSAGTKPRSVGNAQSRPRRRRSDPPPKRASHRCYYSGSHG